MPDTQAVPTFRPLRSDSSLLKCSTILPAPQPPPPPSTSPPHTPASPVASLASLVVCVFSSLSLVPLAFSTFANLF